MHSAPPSSSNLARRRALRAALAVSFAGTACASRTSEPEPAPPNPDLPAEASGAEASGALAPSIEIEGPIVVEGRVEEPGPTPLVVPTEGSGRGSGDLDLVGCDAVADGECPEHCDRNSDIDCCEGAMAPAAGLCHFVPEYGCQCAVIGPFNPPEL
jgi:hypothetical protein